MSKQDELLDWLGRYHDGLSVRDIQKKLPLNWFSGADHNKEVRNALEQLKRKGLAKPVDIGNGVNHWFKVEPAPTDTTTKGEDGPATKATDGVTCGAAEGTAEAGTGVDASASVDDGLPVKRYPLSALFGEPLPPIPDTDIAAAQAYVSVEEVGGEAPPVIALALEAEMRHPALAVEFHGAAGPVEELPRGIECVPAYRVIGTEFLFISVGGALEFQAVREIQRKIEAFLDGPAAKLDEPSNDPIGFLKAWEAFKKAPELVGSRYL